MKHTLTHSLCLAVLVMLLFGHAAQAQSVHPGWTHLLNNDFENAEREFMEHLKINEADTVALLGLTWLNAFNGRNEQSVSWLGKAILASRDPHTLLYATMGSPAMRDRAYDSTTGMPVILHNLQTTPDKNGVVAFQASQYIADGLQFQSKITEAYNVSRSHGILASWRVIGPFDNVGGYGHVRRYDPDTCDDAVATYRGARGALIRWFVPPVYPRNRHVVLHRYYSSSGTFYAVTYVMVDSTQRAQLRVSAKGALKVWLNDVQVLDTLEAKSSGDGHIVSAVLSKGWNKLLMKCSHEEADSGRFAARFTSPNGQPIDLLESASPKNYTPGDATWYVVEDEYMSELRRRVREEPDAPHHRFLLTTATLGQNDVDNAYESASLLTQQYPNSALAVRALFQACLLSLREDRFSELNERLIALSPRQELSTALRMVKEFKNRNYDSLQALVEEYKQIKNTSVNAYDEALDIPVPTSNSASESSMDGSDIGGFTSQDASTDSAMAFLRFFASGALSATASPFISKIFENKVARLASSPSTSSQIMAAVKDLLQKHYTVYNLLLLATVYENTNNIQEWRRVYERLFELDSAQPGYFYYIALVLEQRQQYDLALSTLHRAIDITPNVAFLWKKAAELQLQLRDTALSIPLFEQAIALDPSDLSSRESLRLITRAPDPWNFLPEPDVRSVARDAASLTDPSADYVLLVDDTRIVIYDGSFSERRNDLAYKILTPSGIDALREYSVDSYSNGETSVQKSVIIKRNGNEIPIVPVDNEIVFTGLEVGDVVWVQTTSSEFRERDLNNDYWSSHSFNGYVPVNTTRVAVLTMNLDTIFWRTQNIQLAPKIVSTPVGKLYEWQKKSRPAIEYEHGMPPFTIVGEWLHLSTVTSWSQIVDWYTALSHRKSRSSFETRTLMDSLAPRSESLDALSIIERVYTYVTSNIRYSYSTLRQDNFESLPADVVLSARIGDCKDLSTLCIALLAERGIRAWNVLVRTYTPPVLPQLLPSMTVFDHVIVGVATPSGVLYVDPTSEHTPLGAAPRANIDALALHITSDVDDPTILHRSLFSPSNTKVSTTVHIDRDNTARVLRTIYHAGSRTGSQRYQFHGRTSKHIEQSLLDAFASEFPDVQLDSFSLRGVDSLVNEVFITSHFAIPSYVSEGTSFQSIRIPWYLPFEPDEALSYSKRQHDYFLYRYIDTLDEEITFHFPVGFEIADVAPSFSAQHPAATCTVDYLPSATGLTIKRRLIHSHPVVTPKQYASYKTFYNSIVRHDRRHVLLQPSAAGKGQRGRKR